MRRLALVALVLSACGTKGRHVERFKPAPFVEVPVEGECPWAEPMVMGDVATCRGILVPITTLEELNHRARQADQLEQVYNTCEDVRESEGEGKGVAAGFLTGAAVALLALLLL